MDWVMQDDNDDVLCVEQQTNIFCCGKLPLSSFLKQKIWHVKGGKGFRVLLTLKQSCRVLFLASTYLLSIEPQVTQDGQLSPQVAKGLIEWSVGLALAALRPNEWVDFKLQETYDVNHNTKLFRLKFHFYLSRGCSAFVIHLERMNVDAPCNS